MDPEAWIASKEEDWQRIREVIAARIRDIEKAPIAQEFDKAPSSDDLTEVAIEHIMGLLGGHEWFLRFRPEQPNLSQEVKAVRKVGQAAKGLFNAMTAGPAYSRNKRLEGELVALIAKSEADAKYLDSRIRRGRPALVEREILWQRLRHFWIEGLGGNSGRARNLDQEIDSGLVEFIHACSRTVMDPLDCTIDKIDDWLRPSRQRGLNRHSSA